MGKRLSAWRDVTVLMLGTMAIEIAALLATPLAFLLGRARKAYGEPRRGS